MAYNPAIHHRRSIRLKGYDYSQAGLYFITICCAGRNCWFGEIKNGEMVLNDAGKIAVEYLQNIPTKYNQTQLHEFVVMPNHIHAIIEIVGAIHESPTIKNDIPNVGAIHESPETENNVPDVGAIHESPETENNVPDVGAIHESPETENNVYDVGAIHESPLRTRDQRRKMLLSKIVGWYKMNTAKQINIARKMRGNAFWQRNYYEHIIRNPQSYETISQYIINNPAKWAEDKFYSA